MACVYRNRRITFCDIITTILVISIVGYQTGAEDFCITETFNPRCTNDNNVILLEHAQYGRMEKGRCVTTSYGNIGCATDVLNFMDFMCSGKKSCDVSISHQELVRKTPCTMDLSSYLNIAYTCEEVLQLPRDVCKHESRHHVTQTRGFISPMTTKHVRHEKHCRLVIRGEPGQRITFTLYDFALRNDTLQKFSSEQFCQQYLIIRESVIGSGSTICSGEEREREVYTSRGNEVTVELATRTDTPASFLLKYQVVGCPRLKTPDGTYTRYDADDIMTVLCNSTKESFTLKCINTTWTGELRNCTTQVSNNVAGSGGGSSLISLPPIGISIVIILGVAMVIVVYVAVMIVCVLYIKKKRRRRNRHERNTHDTMSQEAERNKMADKGSDLQPDERLPMLTKASLICSSSSDCLETCELHEMKPCSVCNNCSTYMTSQGVAMAREESAYGPGRVSSGTMPNAQQQNQLQSPLKHAGDNTPRGVRTVSSQSSQGQSIPYHPQVRGMRPINVVDSRLFADGPYGFPPSYFKTFAKPATNPAPTNTVPGEPGVTSPDIVPEYATQNSTNAALAVAGHNKDRELPILQSAEEHS